MTVLITGGTGKTATKLIPYLTQSQTSFLLASRTPPPTSSPSTTESHVKFDFADPSTYSNPFSVAITPIKAIYLIVPLQSADSVKITNDFVDFAVKKHGVKRFVLLAATNTVKGGPAHGGVWEHVAGLEGVEITVLEPTWFLENLSSWIHSKSIKEDGKIYSAVGDGKAPWVSVDDISRVAFHALTSSTPLPETLKVLGPTLYTIDQIAAALSRVLGREIIHVRVSPEERVKWVIENLGFPEQGARYLTALETGARDGSEEIENDVVERITGIKPIGLEEWIQENREAWE